MLEIIKYIHRTQNGDYLGNKKYATKQQKVQILIDQAQQTHLPVSLYATIQLNLNYFIKL